MEVSLQEKRRHLADPGYSHNNEQFDVHHKSVLVGMKSSASEIRGTSGHSSYLRFHLIAMHRRKNEEYHVAYQLDRHRSDEERQFTVRARILREPTAHVADSGPQVNWQDTRMIDGDHQDRHQEGEAPGVQAV